MKKVSFPIRFKHTWNGLNKVEKMLHPHHGGGVAYLYCFILLVVTYIILVADSLMYNGTSK